MTTQEFAEGWKHFCNCINFDQSHLDAEGITFMNEMPAAVAKGLTPSDATPAEEKDPAPAQDGVPSS